MKNTSVLKTMTNDKINFSFQMRGAINLILILHFINLFSYPFESFTEILIRNNKVFFGQTQKSKQVKLRVLLLPHLKCNEGYYMTAENTINAMVLFNNFL